MARTVVWQLASIARQRGARALINRNYALFLGGSLTSAMGGWLQTVAVGWLVLELSDSVFLLGVTNFVQMVPILILGMIGGAVCDQVDRRKLLLVSTSLHTFLVAALAVLTFSGLITVPLILAIALAMGIVNAFQWPTWATFIKDLVGADQLRSAIALNSARFNLSRVLGPALAGLLIGSVGTAACLGIGTVGMFGVVLALLAIRTERPPHPGSGPWLFALREGVTYAWNVHSIRTLLLTTAGVGFLASPYSTFLPAFARDVLDIGPEGLGLLLSAVGIGAIVGALASGMDWVALRPWSVMMVLVIGTGLSLMAFAGSNTLHLALLALVIVGFTTIAYLSMANVTVQLHAPDELLGRIMGLWTVVNAGTLPLGSLAIGQLAEHTGVQLAVGIGGAGCALVGLVTIWVWRPLIVSGALADRGAQPAGQAPGDG